MLSPWFGDVFGEFDVLWREMDDAMRALERRGLDGRHGLAWAGRTPTPAVADSGTAWVITMDLPGLTAKDVEVDATGDRVTVHGRRNLVPPEGWQVHRQERGSYEFSRTFAIPSTVDADKATAAVKDGVLTLTLPKAPEIRPRQIEVKST